MSAGGGIQPKAGTSTSLPDAGDRRTTSNGARGRCPRKDWHASRARALSRQPSGRLPVALRLVRPAVPSAETVMRRDAEQAIAGTSIPTNVTNARQASARHSRKKVCAGSLSSTERGWRLDLCRPVHLASIWRGIPAERSVWRALVRMFSSDQRVRRARPDGASCIAPEPPRPPTKILSALSTKSVAVVSIQPTVFANSMDKVGRMVGGGQPAPNGTHGISHEGNPRPDTHPQLGPRPSCHLRPRTDLPCRDSPPHRTDSNIRRGSWSVAR